MISPGVTAGPHPAPTLSPVALTQGMWRSPDPFTVRKEAQLGHPASFVTKASSLG